MQIIPISFIGFAANSYLLTKNSRHAICIDPARPRILFEAEKRGLKVSHALLTHGHFDHIGGCAALQQAGVEIGCLKKEVPLALGEENMGRDFGCPVPSFSIDFTFEDGDILHLSEMEIAVMGTPGHTAGSCCFLAEDALFSGDTLFYRDRGRTDLPTGSEKAIRESLKRLAALENRTVYPGHGTPTTLEEEKKYGILRL